MSPAWENDFDRFLADIGPAPTPKHSIDRIDNDGHYEPGNVRWATQKEQANNRSGIRLKMITFNGVTMNQSDWNKKLGFAHGVINRRIRILGWTIEEALTRPKGYYSAGAAARAKNLGHYAHKKLRENLETS